MMGALSGRDPKETLWSVFTVLSMPRDGEEGEGLITLGKLKAVCMELKVMICVFATLCSAAAPPPCPVSPAPASALLQFLLPPCAAFLSECKNCRDHVKSSIPAY